MPTNNDITLVLRIVNDSRKGIADAVASVNKLQAAIDRPAGRTNAAQRNSVALTREQIAAQRDLVRALQQTERGQLANARAAQAAAAAAQRATAANRINTARARDVENRTKTRSVEREAQAAIRLQEAQATASERSASREVEAEQRRIRAILQTQRIKDQAANREAARVAREAELLNRERQLTAQRVGVATSQNAVAQNVAATKARMAELAVQREQVQVERLRLRLEREKLQLAAMQAAARGQDLLMAQRLAAAEQRTVAARAAALRQQAMLGQARTRQGAGGGGSHGGGGGGLLHALTFGFFGRGRASANNPLGPVGGGGPQIWAGMTGGIGQTGMAFHNLGRAIAASGILYLGARLIDMADTMRILRARVGLVTDGFLQQGLVLDGLTQVAQETRSGLSEVVNVYYGLARNNNALALSQREMLDVTRGISQSIAISGVNAQAASFGLMQLAQAFGSGQLRGDELNSVLEQLPALAQGIAKNVKLMNGEIGVGTPGALKTLAEQGKLSVAQVVDAIKLSLAEFDKAFKTLPVTVAQGGTVMRNGFMVFLAAINDATGATNGLGQLFARIGRTLSSDNFIADVTNSVNALAASVSTLADVLSPVTSAIGGVFRVLFENLSSVLIAFLAFKSVFWSVAMVQGVMTGIAAVTKGLGQIRAAILLITGAQTAAAGATMGVVAGFKLLGSPAVLGVFGLIAAGIAVVVAKLLEARNAQKALKDSIGSGQTTYDLYANMSDEQFKMLDAKQIKAVMASSKDRAQALADLRTDAAAALDEAIVKEATAKARLEGMQNTKDAYGQSVYSADAIDRAKQAVLEANLAVVNGLSDVTALDAEWQAVVRTVELLGARQEAILNFKPQGIATDPSAEQQNRIRQQARSISGEVGRLQRLQEVNDFFGTGKPGDTKQLTDPSKSGLSAFQRELVAQARGVLPTDESMKGLTVPQATKELAALGDQLRTQINADNPLSKALREINDEVAFLDAQLAKGGLTEIEKQLFDFRKDWAKDALGDLGDPNSPAALQAAERLRPELVRREASNAQNEATVATRERVIAAEAEVRLIGQAGAELIAQTALNEQIVALRNKGVAATQAEAEVLTRDILPALREAARTEIGTKLAVGLDDAFRDAALAAEKSRRLLEIDPMQRDAAMPELDLLAQFASQFRMSIAEVEKAMKDANLSAEGLRRTLTDQQMQEALLAMSSSAHDAAQAMRDQAALAGLAGDALEREKFFLEQVYLLRKANKELSEAEARALVAKQMSEDGGFDDAMEKARQAREDPFQGVMNGMERGYLDFLHTAADLATQVADITKSAFEGISDTIAQLVTTGKANFKQFAASILRDVATMIVRFLVLRAIMAAVGYLVGGVPSVGGTGAGGGNIPTPGGPAFAAKGMVLQHGEAVKAYASGGLVSKPTFFPMANGGVGLMGEAGTEAIMPLRRLANGRLGVEATGSSQTNNVFAPTLQINVERKGNDGQGAGAQADNEFAAKLSDQLGKMMDAKMAEFTQRQSRPGGFLSRQGGY